MTSSEYRDGQEIFLLLTEDQARAALDDWIKGAWKCELRAVRSHKTPGSYVIRTFNAVWAARIVKWHGAKEVKY